MTPTEIQNLHDIFCKLTNQEGFRLRFGRDRAWWDWCQCGFTEDDLRLVVRYLRRAIADGRRNPGALKFSNLIGQPDRFEEDLLEARRILGARPPKPSTITTTQPLPGGGERIIEVPRPTERDIIDVSKAFAALKDSLAKTRRECSLPSHNISRQPLNAAHTHTPPPTP